jgi:hypothetical protein
MREKEKDSAVAIATSAASFCCLYSCAMQNKSFKRRKTIKETAGTENDANLSQVGNLDALDLRDGNRILTINHKNFLFGVEPIDVPVLLIKHNPTEMEAVGFLLQEQGT